MVRGLGLWAWGSTVWGGLELKLQALKAPGAQMFEKFRAQGSLVKQCLLDAGFRGGRHPQNLVSRLHLKFGAHTWEVHGYLESSYESIENLLRALSGLRGLISTVRSTLNLQVPYAHNPQVLNRKP